MKTDTVRMLGVVAVAMAGAVAVIGCGQKPESTGMKQNTEPTGVMQRAGAALDKAGEKTAEAAKTTAAATKDAAGRVVEKTGEALEKAGAAVEGTGVDMQQK